MKKIFIMGLVIALIAILVIPSAVFAEDNDTQITGSLNFSITLYAPSDINLGPMVAGQNNPSDTGAGPYSGSVDANGNWNVTATSASGFGGYMRLNGESDGSPLANLFEIYSEDSDWKTADNSVMFSGGPGTGVLINGFCVRQYVDSTDVYGDYGITIIFTGSATP
jgi:hypothetical protein